MGDWQWRAWVGTPAAGKLGAAFLITPTRLLTCAHTVAGRDDPRVGFPGLAENMPVRVVASGGWRGPRDLGDVAVLELDNPASNARARIAAEIACALDEDHAEAIVLGCAGMGDLAASLAAEFGVPVIDGVAAAVVLAEGRLPGVMGADWSDRWEIVETMPGSALVGSHYERPLDWLPYGDGAREIIVPADFVSADDGAGVVHLAPAFGADDYAAGQQFELAFLQLVERAGLPQPSMNRFVEGYELDAYWPGLRFAVELDTYEYHGDEISFEEDRLRHEDLKLAGIEMIRVTGRRMEREPAAVTSRLRRLFAQRQASLGG